MDILIPSFKSSLFDPALCDAINNILELGIDSIIDNDLLKNLPIVNLVIGTLKTGQNLRERNLLRQTVTFIKTFNDNSISPDKLSKHRQLLDLNPSLAEEELGRVLLLLDENIDLKKSQILSRLYGGYINNDFCWNKFCELSEIVRRIFITDLSLLNNIYSGNIHETTQCKHYQAERLISLGLLDFSDKFHRMGSTNAEPMPRNIALSELGKLFIKYIH